MIVLRHMKQYKYSKEQIINSIQEFIKKNGKEPSSHDFTLENNLPNKKTIERRWGGLTVIRKEMGLYVDHRTGVKRTDLANQINERSIDWNQKIYKKLLTYFKEPFVHKESSIFDDRRNRTDFKVYGKKVFLVDIFYPKDRYSLQGCVRLKSNKYPDSLKSYMGNNFDKVIFLNLNEGVPNNVLCEEYFSLMTLDEFWKYCGIMM